MIQDDEPEKKAAPAKKIPKSNVGTIAVLAAIAAAGWGAYEHRRAENLIETLTQATALNAKMQQQVEMQSLELKSVATKLHDLASKNSPVAVIFRPSPSGNGLMTFFKNNAPAPIEIAVLLSNPATERRREVNINLPANGVQSIGEAEGWVFAPGHHVQVTHAQFGTVDYVVPDK
jgi:hypothetical protein